MREAGRHAMANREAAQLILENPDRYGGPGAGLVVWARLVLGQGEPTYRVECPVCGRQTTVRAGIAECGGHYRASVEGLP